MNQRSDQDDEDSAAAATAEARHRGLDELVALSQEMGLYEERRGTLSVSESLYVWLQERAARRSLSPDALAEEILTAYREGR